MYYYNVTVNIDKSCEEQWLHWMKQKHIPDVMNSGYFESFKIFKVEEKKIPSGKAGYLISYAFSSNEKLKAYQQKDAPRLRKEHAEKFSGKFTASREIIEKINFNSPR